ncbi:Ferredoxin--nitrite reductase [hydrothermal vent metagenome]|uniref:Ferredoxin--nitrite reductase n=1 Tax=hydrothermal vent metagenome TaxID=652676 RepID=A0A1W1D2F0_9ZZZZ
MQRLQEAFEARNKKLNKIEKLKNTKDPFDAWEKLEFYAQNGFESIPDEDKGYFLKCFGIYYREKTPQQFMLKLRIPAGYLTAQQAQVIGECAKEFGNDYIDLTTRAQCELRYLAIENIPTILKRLQAVGINAHQTGVDNIRGIMGDPFDDLAFDNILPSHHLILKMQEKFLMDKEWVSTIPRKFNTAITGNSVNRCNVFVHDCCFVLANKDGVYGYNMYLGGKVGEVAKDANIFLKDEDEVLKAFDAITTIFKQYGFRDNRNKNRLHFLIEAVGMDEISNAIRKVAGVDFASRGITMTQIDYFDSDFTKVRLKDNSFAIHVAVPSGIFSGTDMIKASILAKEFGSGELRLDMEQSFYILGVYDVKTLIEDPFFQKFPTNNSYFNHQIACAGTKHCPFGVIENKNDAIELSKYLSKKVPLKESRIRLYWSGCVKGCGIHGLADIGFEGAKAKIDGKVVEAVNVSLGGKLIDGAKEGYSILRAVPLFYVKYYIEELMLQYKALKKEGESFEKFHERVLSHYTKAYIGFFLQLKTYLSKKGIEIKLDIDEIEKTGHNEEYELFSLGRKLYYKLTKQSAFKEYDGYTNKNPNEKIEPITKIVQDIDPTLAMIVTRILDVKEKRAKVFSELVGEFSYE